MKILIIKKEGLNISKQIEILNKYNIEITEKDPEYILTFGGDGTILKAVNFALKFNIPILSINFGRIAYMAHIEKENFEKHLLNLINKKYNILKRPLLECKINKEKYYSLNEIAFKYTTIGEISIFDKNINVCSFRGDGLIISTAIGSTAYAMSAGGSIIHNSLKVINIVPISAQHLSTRPLILPSTTLNINSKAQIFIDGISKGFSNNVKINYSKKYIKLIEIENIDYYSILKNKLDWKG